MRLLWLAAALLLCSCSPPPEPWTYHPDPLPQFSGVISGQVELSGELVMVDDVRVPAGSSLTFLPGTLVWVRPAESTKIDPEYLSSLTELQVQGLLRIAGNGSDPVRFLPLKPLEPVADGAPLWAGISLLPGAVGELSGVELVRAESGVLAQQAEASLYGVRMTDCRTGLTIQSGARLTAERLQVQGGETGLFCWGESVVAVSDSLFSGLDEEGLYLSRECRSRLKQVVLKENAIGLVAPEGAHPGLVFEQNGEDIRSLNGGLR